MHPNKPDWDAVKASVDHMSKTMSAAAAEMSARLAPVGDMFRNIARELDHDAGPEFPVTPTEMI